MSKHAALLLVLVFLTASCIMAANPVLSSAVVVEDSWVSKAPMQVARGGLGVAVVNGKIYAIGGSTQSGLYPPDLSGGFVGTNEKYDPAKDTWITKTSMPTPRAYFAIAVWQNKIYCIGGTVSIGVDDMYHMFSVYVNSGVNEVYDTATDTWETKTPMPITKRGLQANVVGDEIYLVGEDSGGVYNEVYNPVTDTWVTKTPMPSGATDYGSAVLDDKIFVAATSWIPNGSRLLHIYDVRTDEWSQGTPVPLEVTNGAASATTGIMAPKRIYAFKGSAQVYDSTTQDYVLTGSTQVYDPVTDSWTFGATMPTDRFNCGIAVIADKFYVVGGFTPDKPYSGRVEPSPVNEQYTPIGYGKPDPTPFPSLSPSPTSPSSSPESQIEPEPFPTALVAAVSVVVTAVVGAGLLVYFKKRKH